MKPRFIIPLLIFTFLVSCIQRAEDTSELHMPGAALPVITNTTPSEKTLSVSASRIYAGYHHRFFGRPVTDSRIIQRGLPYFYAPVLSSDSLPFCP